MRFACLVALTTSMVGTSPTQAYFAASVTPEVYEAACALQEAWAGDDDFTVEPAFTGFSGMRSFLVTRHGEVFHLKISPAGQKLDDATVRREFANAIFASDHAIGPYVAWSDIERQALLTEYKVMELPELRKAGLGSLVVRANLQELQRLHTSVAPHIPLAQVTPAEATRQLWREARTWWLPRATPSAGMSASFTPASVARYAHQLIARLGAYGYQEGLCHGDYNARNSIWSGGRVWIIDWALLGPCDPLGEVAYYAYHVHTDIDDAASILQHYAGATATEGNALDRLRLHIALFHLNRYALRVQGEPWHDHEPTAREAEMQGLAAIIVHDAAVLGLTPPDAAP